MKNIFWTIAFLVALVMLPDLAPMRAAEPPITDLAFSLDGTKLVATSQRGLQLYQWPELKPIRTVAMQSANVRCVSFSPQGDLVAIGGGDPAEQGRADIYSWPDLELVVSFETHEDSVTAIAWRDNSSLATASLDRRIYLHQLTSESPKQEYEGHSGDVTDLNFVGESSVLVTVAHDQSLRVWDTSSGTLLRSLNQHTQPIRAIAVHPQNEKLPMVATAAHDRTIRFWQPTIGRMVRYIRLPREPLALAWSLDGATVLATDVGGQLQIIDPVEVEVIASVPAIDGWAYSLAVHPTDGSIAIGGAGGQVKRIELLTLQEEKER